MIKKVNEMIKIIEKDGWYFYSQFRSDKQHKNSTKKGR
jgi:predicted RNA binding protein YcfA (HicA-like mRNA interferase family)